jgi:hypothetical protein
MACGRRRLSKSRMQVMKSMMIAAVAIFSIGASASFRATPAVSKLTPQSVELRDIMDFLDIRAWKVRMTSDEPFNSIDVRVVRYERNNNTFVARPIGQSLNMVSLEKKSEQVIAVLWKRDGQHARFQLNFPGHSRADCTVPADVLADYIPIGDGSGMEVDGEHIIAVKLRKDERGRTALTQSKQSMDGYIAIEIDVRLLKGVGD